MFAVAGGIILAVLFFLLLPILMRVAALAAAIVVIGLITIAVFALSSTYVGMAITLAAVAWVYFLYLERVSRRYGVSIWRAATAGLAEPPPRTSWGVVPKEPLE